MIFRPDLAGAGSAPGIEVFQLTSEPDVPGSHVYMEAQIFTPDSRRLVLHRAAYSHSGDTRDPRHRYLVCDLDQDGRLSPLTDETGATAPSVSPDGRFLYYLVDETVVNGGRLTLKRVGLDGTARETLLTLDTCLPGTRFRASRPYPLSTLSSDGRRLAAQVFLGDGQTSEPPFGLLVFDLPKAEARLVLQGPTWLNMHPQYCRSTDPDASHDLLVQEAHNYRADARGEILNRPDGRGIDIHVIRDDGTDFRTMPWGRDGNEFCQGHQCWRGRGTWAVTSTHTRQPPEGQLIEGWTAAEAGHAGRATPGGIRNDLTRAFPHPYFYHFATDAAGRRLVTDSAPLDGGGPIYLAEFGAPGREPLRAFRCLMNPRNGPYTKGPRSVHVHPFLSPDGTLAFFNSDESGLSQAYMIRGL